MEAPNPVAGSAEYVAAGTFAERAEADRIAASLDGIGRISIEKSEDATGIWYSVAIHSDGRHSLDDILQAAWDNGAGDALVVHD